MISKDNSLILDNIRIPLTLGVFFSHATCVVNSELLNYNREHGWEEEIFYWLYTFLSTIFPIFVISGFFLISGYLFFLKWTIEDGEKKWDNKCYQKKLKSRFFTLFIPYILWNLIPLFLIIIECLINNYDSKDLFQELKFCFQGKFPEMFWNLNEWGEGNTGPLNLPLYYIRDLMGMCLIAPVVYFYCKKFKTIGICLLVVINILGYIPSFSGLRSAGITFFTLGAFFSIYNKDIVKELSKYGKYLFFPSIILILFVLDIVKIEGNIIYCLERLFCLIGLVTLFWIIKEISNTIIFRQTKTFKESIFFMYAAHEGLWIINLAVFISKHLSSNSSNGIIFIQYIVSIILTIVFCMSLYVLLKKIMPVMSDILNGKYRYMPKIQKL